VPEARGRAFAGLRQPRLAELRPRVVSVGDDREVAVASTVAASLVLTVNGQPLYGGQDQYPDPKIGVHERHVDQAHAPTTGRRILSRPEVGGSRGFDVVAVVHEQDLIFGPSLATAASCTPHDDVPTVGAASAPSGFKRRTCRRLEHRRTFRV